MLRISAAAGLLVALAFAAAPRPPAAGPADWPQPARMPGFGDGETLSPSQISDLTEYVLALAGAQRDAGAVVRAVPLYQAHCAACHGLGGEGAPMLGTPDLTRRQFRQVTGPDDIRLQIWHGSDGRGPQRETQLWLRRNGAGADRAPGA